MGREAEHRYGTAIYRDQSLQHLITPHAPPINDDLQILLRLDLQAMMKMSNQSPRHNFFAGIDLDALIRNKSQDRL